MWILAEASIVATDVAELVGSALALKLLFGLPLRAGVVVTSADVLLVLMAGGASGRRTERIAAGLLMAVGAGLLYDLWLARPAMGDVLRGYVPSLDVLRDSEGLALAVAIVGATVMPHNLYLHSHLAASRGRAPEPVLSPSWRTGDCRRTLGAATFDTVVSLTLAMVLNSALLVLAAVLFHGSGHPVVMELGDAHRLLAPLLGTHAAGAAFALALLAAGQSATITGTLAGQVVACGFVRLRLAAPARRLITRMLAVLPALGILAVVGDGAVDRLLVGSQVVLGLGLPCVIVPLLLLVADRARMGALRAPMWMTAAGWLCGGAVCLADGVLVARWVHS
jgi:manganese transport protein